MKIKFVSAFFLFFTSFIFSAHAGGAGATQTGGSAQGAQTAALNAMNEGSARVSGNTVTLTKGIGLQRDLTVPAGVTLELTGDGGIYLMRDNITGIAYGAGRFVLVGENGKIAYSNVQE